ncbi:MAG: hypothetical protein ACK53A_10040 [Gemmatimonadota bacterium]
MTLVSASRVAWAALRAVVDAPRDSSVVPSCVRGTAGSVAMDLKTEPPAMAMLSSTQNLLRSSVSATSSGVAVATPSERIRVAGVMRSTPGSGKALSWPTNTGCRSGAKPSRRASST